MLKSLIKKLIEGKNLSTREVSDVIEFIAEGNAMPSQIGSFLTALSIKGESVEEITGLALKMRELAVKINIEGISEIIDSCGTGGDGANTFNISTASAIVAASGGICVGKHSNFGFSSKCGSSNVIEALGIKLAETPEKVTEEIERHGISFIHAPYFHKCTSYVNDVRKEIGIRTVFNYLGPLTNPLYPSGQVLGVSRPDLAPNMAKVLKNLGCKRAMVVNATDPNLDEISICGKTIIHKLENNNIESMEISPEDFGIERAEIKDICGGDPHYNAKLIENIFKGEITDSRLDIVLLNSAALFWAGNKTTSLEEGIKMAKILVENGKVYNKLLELRYC